MGDFKFPNQNPPGTAPGPIRDQDPNMPIGGTQVAPPMSGGDVWQAPGVGYGTPVGERPGPGVRPPPTPIGPPQYQPPREPVGPPVQPPPPVRQPMGPPMPQVKPQARPGGPGMTSSTGSMSRGLSGGVTPPVRQPPQGQPNPGRRQPPPYPTKYPIR